MMAKDPRSSFSVFQNVPADFGRDPAGAKAKRSLAAFGTTEVVP
jgi:hypothetical protein